MNDPRSASHKLSLSGRCSIHRLDDRADWLMHPSSKILTLLFGAVPALIWLPLLGTLLFVTAPHTWQSTTGLDAMGMIVGLSLIVVAVLALWGVYALWAAVLGPYPVERSTAIGMGAGFLAMTITLVILGFDGAFVDGLPFEAFGVWMTAGPMSVAAWHVYRYVRAPIDR